MRALGATAALAATLAMPVGIAYAEPPPPPTLPEPTYQSVSQELLIEMDDGVKLGATIAFPSEDGEKPLPGQLPGRRWG